MSNTARLTPAMRQYMQAKKETPADAILLFRMGDFYELFFDDAKRAAPLMDVVLTQRAGVPMCGVPYHALETYVARLLEGGVKVAIAEQVEDPKLAKGLVKRAVTRVITPGTVLDGQGLNAGRNNFLAAVSVGARGRFGMAMLDVTTGEFRVTELAGTAELETELHRLRPAECLVPAGLHTKWEADGGFPETSPNLVWTPLEDWRFDPALAHEELCRHFGTASLDGFGCRDRPLAVGAAGAVFYYARESLRRDLVHVTRTRYYHPTETMVLDRIAQRNLELVESIFPDAREATLLSVLDATATPMGSRTLREWVLRPLRDIGAINRRLDVVDVLVRDPMLLAELREALGPVRDLERTIVRLNLGTANARDLVVLRHGLEAVPGLRALLAGVDLELVRELREALDPSPELAARIRNAIVDEPPATLRDGGIFRDGFNEELDELRRAAVEGKDWIAALQVHEQERTGIKSLKVRYNKVFGYFIEVTRANLALVPPEYTRKQTLVNAERFITPELKEIESKILGAEERSKGLEYDLFQELREQAVARTAAVQELARAVGVLDALASLAEAAVRNNYRRPELTPGAVLDIRDGRHPVLERLMQDEPFIPNDVFLNNTDNQIAIITGPNMAGKSTYIRQTALIVIMAQMGGFVPAASARIGVVDRIFTRVGAADDLSRGQSTFMVEMVETANILNNATAASLIILDEVGRGTSTFDGLSLAWAVAEYLHDCPEVKARTLFATHYHELTELALTKSGVRNYNVDVREWGEQVVFLRKIVPGAADKSYGIHVARLAGLPESLIQRAREVLENLESNAIASDGAPVIAEVRAPKGRKKRRAPAGDQPSLFAW
ncbi:MAG: DNA mismatch repair protein MutS [Kiritimatiellaeota bacterium]|nr:DNA mismatch repair protein MutS [Kiritimatiellota bacterium]